MQEVRTRVPLGVLERRNITKFGDAAVPKDCTTKEVAIMEHPLDDESKEEDADIPPPPPVVANAPQPTASREDQTKAAVEVEYDLSTSTTIKVSNISRTADEQELRELFGSFGRMSRFYVPKVNTAGRDVAPTAPRENKSYAIITYDFKPDADRAFAALNGRGFDHLILNLEWIKPSDPPAGGGGGGSRFMSGYGQRLAQDTNDNVQYMSHGNANRR